MSYDTVEAGLLTVIRLLSDYSSSNSSQGDYRILAKGVTRAVILQPGPILIREVVAAPRRVRTRWAITLELFIPFSGEVSTISSNIRTFRQTLIDQIDKYPTLNSISGVVTAFVISGDEPMLWQGESRRWWVQKLRVEVEERTTVTIAE